VSRCAPGDRHVVSPNSSVLLLGYHGRSNTGDDALACAISSGLNRRFHFTRFLIPAEPGSLPVLPAPMVAQIPLPWLTRGRYRRNWRTYAAVWKAKVLIFAGGAILHELVDFRALERYVRFARHCGTAAIGGIGVSLGPFDTRQKMEECGRFLSTLDFLTVRDSTSHQTALGYRLPYEPVKAVDVALTLADAYGIQARPKGPVGSESCEVGISVCSAEVLLDARREGRAHRHQNIAAALRELSRDRRIRAHLFQFNADAVHSDGPYLDDLAGLLDGTCEVLRHSYSPDPSIMWRQLASMDVAITMRFHASVFAYAAGVPFVMLDYHPKCRSFAEDVGMPRQLVLDAGDFTSDALVRSVNALVSGDYPDFAVSAREAFAAAQAHFDPVEGVLRTTENLRVDRPEGARGTERA